ncbi:ankyrin repeat protein [Klosneuvirus KNV1]|uniref:Ankyrin repeat protein n=1 Tax=Klosneuvirus KNV1 TaxID=1977640 RepID=A0A1V0SJJ4_9VIRU|nr:ankyrin repeat protein [Klosneuvirus KNV1]
MEILPNEIINLLLFEYFPIKDIRSCLNSSKFFHILSYHQLNIIKKAYNLDIEPYNCFFRCICFGYLDTCKWIWNIQIPNRKIQLVVNGKLQLNDDESYYQEAFNNCCINGNLETVQWCYELYLQKFNNKKILDIHDRSEHTFRIACVRGKITIAKWLYDMCLKENTPIDIYADDDYAFLVSCQDGKLEVVQWLLQLSIELGKPFDIHQGFEYCFRLSCVNGHLPIAQWIYELGIQLNSPVNIHIWNLWNPFESSCKNGHLNVAQWLYDLGLKNNQPFEINNELFDIVRQQDNHEYTQFRSNNYRNPQTVYRNGHLGVLKWLYQLGQESNIPIDITLCEYNQNPDINKWCKKIQLNEENNERPNKKPRHK